MKDIHLILIQEDNQLIKLTQYGYLISLGEASPLPTLPCGANILIFSHTSKTIFGPFLLLYIEENREEQNQHRYYLSLQKPELQYYNEKTIIMYLVNIKENMITVSPIHSLYSILASYFYYDCYLRLLMIHFQKNNENELELRLEGQTSLKNHFILEPSRLDYFNSQIEELLHKKSGGFVKMLRLGEGLSKWIFRDAVEYKSFLSLMKNIDVIVSNNDPALSIVPIGLLPLDQQLPLLLDKSCFILPGFTKDLKNQLITEDLRSPSKLKMGIIADPVGNSKSSSEEGYQLWNFLQNQSDKDLFLSIDYFSMPISREEMLEILSNYHILHISGHGNLPQEDKIGWQLSSQTILGTADLEQNKRFPLLIFTNTCYTGGNLSFIKQLLQQGTKGVIGSMYRVEDRNWFEDIKLFYQLLFNREPFYVCLREMNRLLFLRHKTYYAYFQAFGNPFLQI